MGIDSGLTVSEVLERWPATAAVFVRRCMACAGCAMAPFDTIDEAAAVYGIRAEGFLAELQLTAAEEEGGQR
jgi:hybrid cluster-associated redox disulfide protein